MRKDIFPFEVGALQRDSPSKLVDGVVQHLEMTMAVGLLSQGEALPSEAELANKLGVSTVTLRHALTILRDRGLIQTRRGRGGGSYVQDSSHIARTRIEAQLRAMSMVELRDLGDTAAAVVGAAARLAALRALPEDVAELEELAVAFSQATDAGARRRADSRFHIQLGMAAQSSQLTTLIIQVMGQVAPLLWMPGWPGSPHADREHQLILTAIRSRDAEEAQRAVIAHCTRETELLVNRHLALVTL